MIAFGGSLLARRASEPAWPARLTGARALASSRARAGGKEGSFALSEFTSSNKDAKAASEFYQTMKRMQDPETKRRYRELALLIVCRRRGGNWGHT